MFTTICTGVVRVLAASAAVAAASVSPAPAQCDPNYYWVASSGDWSVPEHWQHEEWDPDLEECISLPGVPGGSAHIKNGGTATVTDGVGVTYLHVEAGGLNILDGGLTIPGWTDVRAAGCVTQTGGTHSAAIVWCDGSYLLEGGSFNAGNWLFVGDNGNGVFTQTGGHLAANATYVGYTHYGTFTQTGGTNNAQFLHVGMDGGTGTYELSGTGELAATMVVVGPNGHGTFLHAGGTLTSSAVFVGGGLTGTGLYQMNGGTVSAGGFPGVMGVYTPWGQLIGPGTFNITVGYKSPPDYGTGFNRTVEAIFPPNGLTVGGAYIVEQLTPDDFAGGMGLELLESCVFDVTFDGSYVGEFQIAIPYDPNEVSAQGVSEEALRVFREAGPEACEKLRLIDVDTVNKRVIAESAEFGKFAVGVPHWTVLVYLNGDDSILDGASFDDFNELELAAGNCGLNIVVCWDRLGEGNSAYYVLRYDDDPSEPGAYEEGVDVFPMGELNMGDPTTLTDFTGWAIANNPAKHYLLVIWNHGLGWGPRGVSWDETDGSDFFTTNELRDALGVVAGQAGGRLDIVGFDACLMQMLEVAYAVRGCCDYVVGSEELEPCDGWAYDAFLPGVQWDSDPGQVCVDIVTTYHGQGYPTLSAVGSAGLDELAYRVDILADELLSGICAEPNNIQLVRQTSDLVTFDYDWQGGPPDQANENSYVDLGCLCQLLAAQCETQQIGDAANGVRNALSAARIANATNGAYYAPAEGISIYFPDHQPDWVGPDDFYANYQNESATPADLDFVADTRWWHFVKAYVGRSPCGDVNGDGEVNLGDLAEVLGSYGTTGGTRYVDGDLDGDGDVDLSDLAELLGHYGEGT